MGQGVCVCVCVCVCVYVCMYGFIMGGCEIFKSFLHSWQRGAKPPI